MELMELVITASRWWLWWKKWTYRERSLCCLLSVAVALLCALLITLIVLFSRDSNSRWNGDMLSSIRFHKGPSDDAAVVHLGSGSERLCISEACTKAANGILEAMDQEVDPCEDFYTYACGGWLKKNVIPEDKSRYSVFSQVKEELELTLKRIMELPVRSEEWKPVAQSKKMYRACMNETAIEDRGGQPVIDLLKKYVDFPVLEHPVGSQTARNFEKTFNWVDTVGKLRRDGGIYLINMGVWADSRNTTRQIIYIDQPGVGMPSTEYMLRGEDDRYVKAYYTFMVETAVLLGADRSVAERDFSDVLHFEIAIAQTKTPREQRRDATRQYNKMSLHALQNRTDPGLDWLRYFNLSMPDDVEPSVTWEELVIVNELDYFNKFLKLMHNTTQRTVANYIAWRVVQSVVWDMDSRFREVYNKYRNVLYGTSMEKARWRSCVGVATGYFDMAVGKLYVEDSLKNGSRTEAEAMIDDISEAFNELLDEVEWMDVEAKAVARKKAQAINRKIAYPDMIHNQTALEDHFKEMIASEYDHFENVHLNSRAWAQKSLRELRIPFDKNKWAATPAEVNAFYSIDYNSITFPAGILQPPFFDKDRPKSINYGAIGMVIGHEITHGFDDQGRQKDKDGNLRDWWPASTVQRFKNKASCIIKQYEEFYVPEVNMTLNGVNTQGENIADNGGLKQAYRAYRKWKERTLPAGGSEPRLPGLAHVSHEKLLFLSYAHIWCGLSRPDAYANDILSGVHSPDKYRVTGPLRNLKEFSEAFHCPEKSPMNPPAEEKCQVW
ncbi:membrane metallo-endopeptidase-like 1 isoform X2 [Paramacrobiotus metropolitanus]|uniref:membrane metallo-endopeptidase-like 1 isoform X2 n=1 Tax=Paramacrobiotus metropolitanus TaxID=2943436 RepID=UPI0024462D64|nr:membrane metallo-endopeptidase-like 1 isoform X2 [Paramacrobiotus metropolitanus]